MSNLPAVDKKKTEANIFFRAKKYEEAVNSFTEAIQLYEISGESKPQMALTLYSDRSATYHAMSRWEEAADDGLQCITIEPNYVEGYYRIASALNKLCIYDRAQRVINDGLNIDPTNKDLLAIEREISNSQLAILATSKKTEGNKLFRSRQYEKAIAKFSEGISLYAYDVTIYSNRSAAYAALKQWQESFEDGVRCIEVDASFVKGYCRTCTALLHLGDLDEATKYVDMGLAIDTDNPDLLALVVEIDARLFSARKAEAQSSLDSAEVDISEGNFAAAATALDTVDSMLLDLPDEFTARSIRLRNILSKKSVSPKKILSPNRRNLTVQKNVPTLPPVRDSDVGFSFGDVYENESEEYVNHGSRMIKAEERGDHNLRTPTKETSVAESSSPTSHSGSGDIRKRAIRASIIKATSGENLEGDDFLQSAWLPPSLEKSAQYRNDQVFEGGNASLLFTHISSNKKLATGARLYFLFLKYVSICMFVSTILAVPALVFAFYGSAVLENEKDTLGLYRTSIGNIGFSKFSTTYESDSQCSKSTIRESCIRINGFELSLSVASNVVSAMEFLQIILYLVLIILLQQECDHLDKDKSLRSCSVSDYSIAVSGLPPSCTTTDLIEHFSTLYSLNKVDWKNRPPVNQAYPVSPLVESESMDDGNDDVINMEMRKRVGIFEINPILHDSWIADITLHCRNKNFLARLKRKEIYYDNFLLYRAQMKLFHGLHREKAYKAAEKKMQKALDTFDTFKGKFLEDLDGTGDRGNNKIKKKMGNESSADDVMDTLESQSNSLRDQGEVVMAFITFQYNESMARCVEDYKHYSSFPGSLFYPPKLKLRTIAPETSGDNNNTLSSKIRIIQAPEPDEILWENLEVRKIDRFFRTRSSFLFALFVMIICFIIVLEIMAFTNLFAKSDLSLCQATIPALYIPSNSSILRNPKTSKSPFSAALFENVVPTRPPDDALKSAFDDQCDSMIPNSVYGIYAVNGDFKNTFGNYDITACSTVGICPRATDAVTCPCVNSKATDSCSSRDCFNYPGHPADPYYCKVFPASVIGDCFCLALLNENIASLGVSNLLESLQTNTVPPQFKGCEIFLKNYVLSQTFPYISIVATSIINFILQATIAITSEWECHTSAALKNGSLFVKTFLTLLFNLAVPNLVASGYFSQPPETTPLMLFQGAFADFDQGWFANVGTYFIKSFVIDSFVFAGMKLAVFYILVSCKTFYFYIGDKIWGYSSIAIRQIDLDKIVIGRAFDVTSDFGHSMTLLFFGMIYAAGLPIMVPLMSGAFFIFYFCNKVLLLRYNAKPSASGTQIMRVAIRLMPYGAIIRSGLACWMFSGPIFAGDLSADKAADAAKGDGYADETSSFKDRLIRTNVLPLLVLFVILLAVQVFVELYTRTPLEILVKRIASCFKYCLKKKGNEKVSEAVFRYDLQLSRDRLRREVAPFTEDYFKFILTQEDVGKSSACNQSNNCCGNNYSRNERIREVPISLTDANDLANGWVDTTVEGFRAKMKPFVLPDETRDAQRSPNFDGDEAPMKLNLEEDEKSNGSPVTYMRTYEIIAEKGLNSYAVEKLPSYRTALQALMNIDIHKS